MRELINSIADGNYVAADSIISETVELIMAKKLEEAKKMCAAKMTEQQGHVMNRTSSQLTRLGVVEEDNVEEANDPAERTNLPVEKGTPKQPSNTTVINKNNLGGPGSTHYKNMQEEETEEQLNELTPIARQKYVDAVRSKPGIFKGIRRSSLAGIEGDKRALETQIERSKKDSRQSAWSTSDLERARKNLKTKHERRKNIADKVAAGLEESANQEELDEARINIIRARIRGGKIQRRKKISNVPGMTIRGGKLQRMSAAERRRRKMGARKAVRKRAPTMNRALMKRKRSLMKRRALGL